MLLVLVLISTVAAVPLPEFNLQSGGRVVQREIPTFDGVDWSKSRRGGAFITLFLQFFLLHFIAFNFPQFLFNFPYFKVAGGS